ncbi:helix-turn-helix domain-containing protein [uncultured Rhodoblastus sp.]|uniref:helix-turn-helix domain-containing protein n=1 Tax=uncultured Rhodoblastus sp. TaxID=543037 RepID=UPI0025D1121F|nr:helix-turn-helix domain-containing protein [uncultured Rhodoblastus sp.]
MTKASEIHSTVASSRPLSVGEAARALGVSSKTLRGHVKDGAIPWISIGRGKDRKRRKFDPQDLETFKQSRKIIGEAGCPSTKEKDKIPTPSISSKGGVGLREILDQRTAAKRNASKNANAKKRGT